MKVQVQIAQVIRRTWHLIGLGVKLRAYAAEAWHGGEISESAIRTMASTSVIEVR